MQTECPLLIITLPPDASAASLEWFRAVVEGPATTVVDYDFHLLQALAEAGRMVRKIGTQVVLGYVMDQAEGGEPVILARDAAIQSSKVEAGRCRLRLELLPRAVYQPAFVPVPLGGKWVFMIPQPTRMQIGEYKTPRWLRRWALWLFAHTGWTWCLHMVRDEAQNVAADAGEDDRF